MAKLRETPNLLGWFWFSYSFAQRYPKLGLPGTHVTTDSAPRYADAYEFIPVVIFLQVSVGNDVPNHDVQLLPQWVDDLQDFNLILVIIVELDAALDFEGKAELVTHPLQLFINLT